MISPNLFWSTKPEMKLTVQLIKYSCLINNFTVPVSFKVILESDLFLLNNFVILPECSVIAKV